MFLFLRVLKIKISVCCENIYVEVNYYFYDSWEKNVSRIFNCIRL